MKDLHFEWDPRKATANLLKHRISFEEAQTAFQDEGGLLLDDPDHSKEEDRFVLIGMSVALRVLLVCHCGRQEGDLIRIISARKATRKEQGQYHRR